MKNAFDEKILDEADQWLEQNKKVILATVVQKYSVQKSYWKD